MKTRRKMTLGVVVAAALAIVGTSTAFAKGSGHGTQRSKQLASPGVSVVKPKESVTSGSVTVDGKQIPYKAIAGVLVVRNYKGEPYVSMSYVAYVKEGVEDEASRPITFIYDGGPGGASSGMNVLAWGPKQVVVGNATLTPPAPYKLVNNDESLLDVTDEVFVDEPSTGLGRIITKKMGGVGTPKMVYGIDQDARAFARFIKEYLIKSNRSNSPKFLYGESYGTTRDAVLAYDLTRSGVALDGVVFQSAVINWDVVLQFANANPNTITYATGLPTEAAIAWYHHKVPNEPEKLQPFLRTVEKFAMGPYVHALNKGNLLGTATKQKIAQQMHAYIGLPTAYIVKANLRIDSAQFRHKLLSGKNEVTSRLDGRYTGPDLDPLAKRAQYDPLSSAVGPPMSALYLKYVRNTLAFGKGMTYRPGANVGQWQTFHHEPGSRGMQQGLAMSFFVNVMPDIAGAMKLNPNMRVMVAEGYFDLGTPFYAAKYEFEHLRLPKKLQANISYRLFHSGHLIYLNPRAHKKLHDATAAFISASDQEN